MKALVYGGPGEKAWTEVPDPTIVDSRDAIIRVDAVTICGTGWRPAVDLNKVIMGGQVVAIVALLTLRAVVKARWRRPGADHLGR
jgi:threonine dehydrogenase-like Zn-dependent dehydrogenase